MRWPPVKVGTLDTRAVEGACATRRLRRAGRRRHGVVLHAIRGYRCGMAAQRVDTDSERTDVDEGPLVDGSDDLDGSGDFSDSDEADDSDDSDDELYGFAVAVVYDEGRWSCTPLSDDAREGLDHAVTELRDMRAAGPVFGLVDVDEAFFAVIRPGPGVVHLALSDGASAVDYDLAADILDVLGVDVPDLTPDELEEVDPWPEGDLGVLADLGLPEPVLGLIMDEIELYPDEQLAMIAERLGFDEEFAAALDGLDR